MPRYDSALQKIGTILSSRPKEPFLDLPRRPNGYRDTPSYRQWMADTEAWIQNVVKWFHEGLSLYSEPDTVCVTLYDHPLESTRLTRLPDGLMRWPGPAATNGEQPLHLQPGEQLPRFWVAPLELPGPRQTVSKFLEQNSKRNDHYTTWDLDKRVFCHAQHTGIQPPPDAWQDIRHTIKPLALRWIAAAHELIDPEPLLRIRKAAGNAIGHNLFFHNLSVASGDLIDDLAATNPGIVAWWLCHLSPGHKARTDWHRRRLWKPDSREPAPPLPPDVPNHPGMIIAAVRKQLRAYDQANWKMLAAQPAKDIVAQLNLHGPEGVVLMTRILADAALPKTETTAASKRPRPTAENATQLNLFGEPVSPLPPPVPVRQQSVAQPPAYRQPPLPLKIAILDLLHQRAHPRKGQRAPRRPPTDDGTAHETGFLDHAMLHLSVLAVRHFGDDQYRSKYDQRNVRHYSARLNHAADYAYHDPEAALRRKTWTGLAKASEQWHREEAIRRIYQNLEQQAEAAGCGDESWDAPLAVHRTPDFTAYLLKTPFELLQESQTMSHCVSSGYYTDRCGSGLTRIFHLQPASVTAYDPESQKKCGSTVQIDHAPQGWRIGQHQGHRNRDPDDAEEQWADQLLAAWLAALKETTGNPSGSLQ